jgi:hypothetical protein
VRECFWRKDWGNKKMMKKNLFIFVLRNNIFECEKNEHKKKRKRLTAIILLQNGG